MKNLEQLSMLLAEKKDLFLKYEEATSKMSEADEETIEIITHSIEARQQLIKKIDDLDARITDLCSEMPDGALLYEASKNRCGYAALSEEEKGIYHRGQEVFQVITRIQEEEALAVANMSRIVDRLQILIKQNHQEKKFAGYLKTMNQGLANGFLYDKKR